MSVFLKIVSAIYLIMVWLAFVGLVSTPVPAYGSDPLLMKIIAFIGAVTLSIPAVALYAFGQVVGDVRAMRNHLHAVRKYYEPSQKYEGL